MTTRTNAKALWLLGLALSVASVAAVPGQSEVAAPVHARNVVLVHGAWADGSSWSDVIPIRQKAGLHVTAVQNPLTSLEESVQEPTAAALFTGRTTRLKLMPVICLSSRIPERLRT